MSHSLPLKIIPTQYFSTYAEVLPGADWNALLITVPKVDFTPDTFGFYVSVASVFSSKIEGENIELDSYLRHRFMQGKYKPDYTRKIDDLFAAYKWAQKHRLTLPNALKVHSKITKNILPTASRGRIRTKQEIIVDTEGRIEYTAADAAIAADETEKLFEDVAFLLAAPLTVEEIFYIASMLHLVFLKIHPFEDGNGRLARLLEKWFLAEKFGEKAWYIPSERYYYEHLRDYYRHIHIGQDYERLNYARCLPFLLMLPEALQSRGQ